MNNDVQRVSVVIPVYNGADTIGDLCRRLMQSFEGRYALELVLINDGSPKDNSAEVCAQLAKQFHNIVFIDLSTNFGEHNAVMAGLNHSTGDCTIIMDDDFQNPPEEVFKLIDEYKKGAEVVYSRYEKKKHHFLRNLGSRFNGYVATLMLGKPADLYLSSFKLISPFLVRKITEYEGAYPYIDGLIFRVTRNYATVLVEHNVRSVGESNYTIKKLISLWLNMFVNFSILPLRVVTLMGLLFSALAFLGVFWAVISKLNDPSTPMGWASLLVAVLFLGSIQLVCLGILGEYLGRLFLNSNKRPQFSIRRIHRHGQVIE
jgi:glycosyltransferase involved in cell wall biosynthesis